MPTGRTAGRALLALALSLALSGCLGLGEPSPIAQVPVQPPPTRSVELPNAAPRTVAPTTADEAEHKRMVAMYGGAYRLPAAEQYLDEIVARLAAQSERPDIPYRLTLLNSSSVNAFALPSGRIYITRGLLALANDSAEIAAVIAHEMAHVSARHALARANREQQTSLVARVMTEVVSEPADGAPSALSARQSLASFSRQQELEADAIGVKTSARAGFDPYGASRFLATMGRQSDIRAASPGIETRANAYDFLDTHPTTPERVAQAVLVARQYGAPGVGSSDRVGFLQSINGLTYGDDPREGILRGRQFLHPGLGFGFVAPAGFTFDNTPKALLGVDGGGRALRLDTVRPEAGQTLATYLASGWIEGVDTGTVEPMTINGLEAATAVARGPEWSFRLYAIRFGRDVYRMIFAARQLDAASDQLFRETAASFRALSAAEKADARPLRVRIVTIRDGDSFAAISRQMAYADRRLERFMILNGFDEGSTIEPGRRVKIVTE